MIAIYRLVVRLAFPRRVRRRFGADMVRMFERQLAATRATGGSAVSLFRIFCLPMASVYLLVRTGDFGTSSVYQTDLAKWTLPAHRAP